MARPELGSLCLKHGAWWWRYRLDGPNGRRIQKWERLADYNDQHRTQRDVLPLVTARIQQLGFAAKALPGSTRIVDFVEREYLPMVNANKRPATADGYRKIWLTHLRAHFADMRLAQYQPHHAARFLSELPARGLGRQAVNHVRSLMSGIFRHAVSKGRLSANPMRDVDPWGEAPAPKATEHYIPEEMRAILRVLEPWPQGRVAMALSFTGLRTAEIMGLRWEDVAADKLFVRRSVWRGKAADCKTTNSRREVTLGPTVASILQEYRKRRESVSGFVLENERALPLDLHALAARTIRPALAAGGIPWKGYYAGRRGAETEMNRHTNGNSQITSHHFGHSKEVADAHYVKPLPEETRRAALALDAALRDNERQERSAANVIH